MVIIPLSLFLNYWLNKEGGGNSEAIDLPEGVDIKKIEVNREDGYGVMSGVRMHLTNGDVKGQLNARGGSNVFTLGMSRIASLLALGCTSFAPLID